MSKHSNSLPYSIEDEKESSEKLNTDWDPELLIKPDLRDKFYFPKGLMNLGNGCYMNSVIQSLAHIPLFTKYLINHREHHSKKCEKKATSFCLTCYLIRLIPEIIQGSIFTTESDSEGSPLEFHSQDVTQLCALGLVKSISDIMSQSTIGSQEDASEFLISVLQMLKSEFIAKSNEKNIIDVLFLNNMTTTTVCCDCDTERRTKEKFYVLQSDINDKNINDLSSSIKNISEPEILSENNAYFCNKCNKKVDYATKTNELNNKLSDYLIITLNRFIYNKKTNEFSKNNKKIFYKDIIHINNNIYRLNSTIVHCGGKYIDNGHYFTYCRGINNKWFKINDNNVKQVNKETVFEETKPYILFYRKICDLSDENQIDTGQ